MKLGKWPSVLISLSITTATIFLFQNCSKEELDLSGNLSVSPGLSATCAEVGVPQGNDCVIAALTPEGQPIWSNHSATIVSSAGNYGLTMSGQESAQYLCQLYFGGNSSLVDFTDADLGEADLAYFTYVNQRLVNTLAAIPGISLERDLILSEEGGFGAVSSPAGVCSPCMLLTTATCRIPN